ncbi:hypothetical protein BLOT_004107 [Blomia tropicalis]|nr:hypothetical protein BLOT_004107 [Blomia tropicalis]
MKKEMDSSNVGDNGRCISAGKSVGDLTFENDISNVATDLNTESILGESVNELWLHNVQPEFAITH